MRKYAYADEHAFLEKVKELVAGGTDPRNIDTFTPVPVHGLTEALKRPPSGLKWFFLFGGLLGCLGAYSFCLYTVYRWAMPGWDWGLITGGKPPWSMLAFTIIGFEMTVLFGALITVLGFLILSRMPAWSRMVPKEEYGNTFTILVHEGEEE